MTRQGVRQIRDAIRDGRMRAEAVVEAALQRGRVARDEYVALVDLDEEAALEAARAVDTAREAGHPLGPLAGVPVTIKDNIAVRGWSLHAGSRVLEGYRSPFDATASERLRDAGAILLGRANMDEFGMGSASTSGVAGAVRHPIDPARVAGGSSGGSAVAVALGAGAASLGTDTGGSVRLPAALCGVVGLKPTYGRVSRYGVVAYASSLDQIGVLAPTVDDAAMILAAIAGPCRHDATSAQVPVPDWTAIADTSLVGVRIGVPRGFVERARAADAMVADAFEATLAAAVTAGAQRIDVEIADLDAAIAAYYVIATAEASTNLSRYDGVRYGHRTAVSGVDLAQLHGKSRSEGFGPEVQRRILLGTFALSAGYHDAFYERAARVRARIAATVDQAFATCDVLAMPTSPVRAWRHDQAFDDPTTVYAMDAYTVLANLCGLPAMSLPVTAPTGSLPIGLQLMAPAFDEARLITVGRALESFGPAASGRGEGGVK